MNVKNKVSPQSKLDNHDASLLQHKHDYSSIALSSNILKFDDKRRG